MEEISDQIFIESSFAGVSLGAINWPHGLILIDSPFRVEDIRSWRSALLNMGGGVDRMLINLDAHPDRTLGSRAMECSVVGQEKLTHILRSRPVTFKSQGLESGAEWELYNTFTGIRWAPPDLSFSDSLQIHWNSEPLLLEHHPGPASGASWVVIPSHKLIFIGDAVTVDQPPFLGFADIPAWLLTLEQLAANPFQNHLLISSRSGIVTQKQVRRMSEFLQKINAILDELSARLYPLDEIIHQIPVLLKAFEFPVERHELYAHRLKWGLERQYYRRYRPTHVEPDE